MRAAFAGVKGYESVLQPGDVRLDGSRIRCRLVHFLTKAIDVRRITLECVTYLVLEVVDDDEIWEERQNILNLQ